MVLKPSLFRYCICFIVGCFDRQISLQFDKNYWVIVSEVSLCIDNVRKHNNNITLFFKTQTIRVIKCCAFFNIIKIKSAMVLCFTLTIFDKFNNIVNFYHLLITTTAMFIFHFTIFKIAFTNNNSMWNTN